MKKIWFFGVGLFLFFGSAGAVDKGGKIGLGFFNDDAPIGARYWINNRFGVDLGFGINMRSVVDSTKDTNLIPLISMEPSKKTLTEFTVDAGLPINLVRREKVNFMVRPGFSFHRRPYFNPTFHDSFQIRQVVGDTVTIPPDTIPTVIIDTIKIPFGSVRDTITEERSQSIDINLNLGIEYFPVENFSVSFFQGVGLTSEKKTKNGNSFWTITHRPFVKGVNLGFHYYF